MKKFIQFGPDMRTPELRKIENQMLIDGVIVGMVLMDLYFQTFGQATKLVNIIGASIPLALVVLRYVMNKISKIKKK